MDISHILDGLNERQREAVTAPIGNHLILAGAGSGKTRVLVHRIAWLIEAERVSPGGVLAVTFTNKAAAEMRSRIEELLRIPMSGMWVGTFHGIAHRLLRMHAQEAGLPENFQILDAADQLRLVKRILRSLEIDEQAWPARGVVGFINRQKDEGYRAQNTTAGDDLSGAIHKRIYTAYEETCNQGGLVDFAELLLRSHELWLNNEELLRHYRHRFRHLLVDEFQDTNQVQYAWLRTLAGNDGHIMAVGDDDQSIYGWRGARIENIQHFERDVRSVTTIRLEQNYRSTMRILKAANGLIEHNTERLGKKLWTSAREGDAILVYSAFNDLDEARFIADRARKWVDEGGSPQDIAVLYRSNAQSRVLEDAFLAINMPYRIYGGMRFFERAEIRNALGYMRLIDDRHVDVAFERVVNTPPRGIGDKTVEAVRNLARERHVSLWEAAKRGIAEGVIKGRAATTLTAFITLIDELAQSVQGASIHEVAEVCVQNTGLMEYHMRERGEAGLARKENLEELITACREFETGTITPLDPRAEEGDTEATLTDFIDQAVLDAGEHQQGSGPSVFMMTLHSAKGLEFPLVFMAGMEEGLFPHRMSSNTPMGLAEERRLAYVGITRAMRQLYFTYAETRRMHGMESYAGPSRFIDEVPEDTMEHIRLAPAMKPARPNPAGLGRTTPKDDDPNDTGIRIGTQVRHGKFGEGIVTMSEGHGERTRVQINFADVGSKWLMLGYANLEVLD